jgi:hypothetical protein
VLAQALGETGGPLTSDEQAWADDILGNRKHSTRSVA